MNYITKLQEENMAQRNQIASLKQSLNDFNVFLHTEKFVGTESDGSRKDWISTGDVINWIRETKGNL